jgi:hypothetical protein
MKGTVLLFNKQCVNLELKYHLVVVCFLNFDLNVLELVCV